MSFQYSFLAETLHETADSTIQWFIDQWGVKKSRIQIEQQIDSEIALRPTFSVPLADGHLLCIEVLGKIYSNSLDDAVLGCRDRGLPVKLVIAVPKDINDPEYPMNLKKAKERGAGVFEIDAQSGGFIHMPLSLSLTGVRPLNPKDFPPKLRLPLQQGLQMFRDGEPGKACSRVYDELESMCRAFARKSAQKNLWKPDKLKIDKAAWASLMTAIDDSLDRSDPLAKPLTKSLVARIVGVTGYRNDVGHLPKTVKDLVARDRALRTRFEAAVDLLQEFVQATKGLRIQG